MFERGNLSRRGFLRRSVAGLTAAGLPAWHVDRLLADDAATVALKQPGANGKINFGWVGIGSPASRALQIYGESRRKGNVERINNVAVCDVDARHVKRAQEILKKDGYASVETTGDFRRLTDRKDVDVVVVATPDHWHALVAIDALRKGKDVYCEKPLTLTVAEALAVKKAADETGRVFQTGNQQRSEYGGMFRLATEVVRAGRIGKVKKIECRIGDNPESGVIQEAPVPEGLDWDMWLGPTAKVPYRYEQRPNEGNRTVTNCHYEFRWLYQYSGGKMTDWGAHHLDIAQWVLGKDGSGPNGVEVVDATPPKVQGPEGYNTHPRFKVRYTYDTGAEVIAMDGRGTPVKGLVRADGKAPTARRKGGKEVELGEVSGDENGVMIFGENGTVFVGRGMVLASDPKVLSEPLGQDDPKLYPTRHSNHLGNFLDCIKSREKPICNQLVGAGSVIVCHLGVIALQTGKKLTWDPKANTFTGENAEEGNKRLAREMRAPWKLEG